MITVKVEIWWIPEMAIYNNNNKRHFFERLSVTLQRENGSMLLERCPLSAADVDGEL